METKIKKNVVTQIGILTSDIQKSKTAWENFFDLPAQPVTQSDGYDTTKALYHDTPMNGRIYQVCFSLGNIELELIQPIDDTPSYWKDCLDQNGPGIHHISFAVKDMENCIGSLETQEMKLMQKGEFPNGRYAYLDASESLHVIVELLEKDQEVFM